MFSHAIRHLSDTAPGALPYDAEVEYLESSTTGQYIDTGITFDRLYDFEVEVNCCPVVATRSVICGTYSGSGTSFNLEFGGSDNGIERQPRGYVEIGGGALDKRASAVSLNVLAPISLSYRASDRLMTLKSGSDTITGTVTSGSGIRSNTLWLFNDHRSGGMNRQVRISSIKVKKDGEIVRDMMAVRVGGEYCLYDKANPTGGTNNDGLYHNAGSGVFLGGSDKAKAQLPYDAEVEYIENTGLERVDTGILPSSDLVIQAAFDILQSDGTWVIGSYPHNDSQDLRVFKHASQETLYHDRGSGRISGATSSFTGGSSGSFEVECGNFYVKDLKTGQTVLTGSAVSSTFSSTIQMVLFSQHTPGTTVNGVTNPTVARIRWCKFYQNGILVRDFIPVRVTTEYCFYDKANPTGGDNGDGLYHNKGTGAFLGGIDRPSVGTKFLVSRVMGDSSGTVKAVRKHYDMPVQYTIDECNGNTPTAVNVYFPSGTYEDLGYTPTWSGHRFVGWYTTSATPSTTAPTSGTQVQKGDSVVFDRSTVYARWQLPTTVTFDATTNGGQMPSGWTAPDYYEGQPYGTLPEPTKSGELFLGWFTSGGTRVTESSIVTSGTLTARYAAVTWATTYSCTTTSTYKNTGIYAANRYSSSDPVVVDWGDGTTDVVYGNISQLAHTYPSAATYTVKISDNISTFCPSYNNSTWYQTTSQNRYTFKQVLTLSSKVTQLSAYAFYYCAAMTNAIIPSGATSIPTYCFYNCLTLKSSTVQLPSTVTSIESYAFYSCNSPNFNSITIPAACTSIGSYGLGYCYYLHPVFESGSATLTLNTYSFVRCGYQGSAFTIDLSPRKVTSIPSYCFQYCRYLKDITWPQGLTTIGGYAFRYCFYYSASTGSVEIPEGVTSISGTYAFANCLYLTAVTLPSTLTNLNDYTFYYCTRLATITSNRSTAPTVSSVTFGNSTTYYTGRTSYSAGTNKLYVPAGATGYNASYWASVLLDSTKCGFTLVEVEPPGIYVEFDNVTSSYGGLTNYTDTLRFDLTPTQNGSSWNFWLRDGQALPSDYTEMSGISIVQPSSSAPVMIWNGTGEICGINDIDTSSPTINPYYVDSGTITIRKVET